MRLGSSAKKTINWPNGQFMFDSKSCRTFQNPYSILQDPIQPLRAQFGDTDRLHVV